MLQARFMPASTQPAPTDRPEFDFEADDLEQANVAAEFELIIGQLVRIAGTVEVIEGDVFIDPETKPAKLSVDKAQLFVAEAFIRGQSLKVRPAFARRIRRALQD